MDEGSLTQCCQTSDRETLETDADAFDCDTCVVRQAIDRLDDDNAVAFGAFRRTCSRFAVQTQSASVVLARICDGLDADDVCDLFDRLSVIYEVYFPPKQPHA